MNLGRYLEVGGRPAVQFERTYPHPIERVWAAITEPAQLAGWFPSSIEYEGRTGAAIRFAGDPHTEDSIGVVLAFDPTSRFAFSWGEDEVHLHLEPIDAGSCRLTLTNILGDRSAAARNASGWSVCLGELDKLIDGRPADGPHSPNAEPWPAAYEAHLRLGLPSGAEIPDTG